MIIIKNSQLFLGPDLAHAEPVTVPRDSGMGAPALVWGIDRSTECVNPLAVDANGNLGIAFCGSVTLGAVTIEDNNTSCKLDVIPGEGQCMSGADNINGIPVMAAYNNGCFLESRFLHTDSSGYLLTCTTVAPSPVTINNWNNEACGCNLNGSAFVGNSCFCTTKQINLISLNFSSNTAKDLSVGLLDKTNNRYYAMQCLTNWTGTDLVITDQIRVSCNMELQICANALCVDAYMYYRVEAESV